MIKNKQIVLKIKRNTRRQIYQIFDRYNSKVERRGETGLTFWIPITEEVIYQIGRFYVPKSYKENQFVETNNLEEFILFTTPYSVLDAIEFFSQYCDNSFIEEINAIFNLNDIPMKLNNGKFKYNVDSYITNNSLSSVQEVGLQELLQEANRYYEKENFKIAVEKLWDAFERLKTYYSSPKVDKKKSVNKIIDDMSGGRKPFKEMFEKEFKELTVVGNKFRIRHHETTKIDIDNDRYFDYFYKRCLTLISIAINYLDKKMT